MIVLSNVALLQKAVGSISAFITEANFRFNDSGITLKAIDPSQILLAEMKIPKNAFEKFDVEPSLVGVDVSELQRILSRGQPGDRLVLDITESELLIELQGELTRSFRLPLLDLNEDEVPAPASKFDVKAQFPGRVLKEALKDASLFGSSVVVKVKPDHFILESKSAKGSLRSEAKQFHALNVKSNDEVVSKYSLGFIQNMFKEVENETVVTLELKSDAPIRCSYTLGAAELQFHLAHMIL